MTKCREYIPKRTMLFLQILIFCIFFFQLGSLFPTSKGGLEKGMQASHWKFTDAHNKEFTMDSWKGKVLLINYMDPDASHINEHFSKSLQKARHDGLLKSDNFMGIGIVDCAATWKPNLVIRMMAAKKAKEYNTTVLFDYKGTLRKAWKLKKDSANVILLDKKRKCKAIVRGRVPDSMIASLVKLAVKLQYKK